MGGCFVHPAPQNCPHKKKVLSFLLALSSLGPGHGEVLPRNPKGQGTLIQSADMYGAFEGARQCCWYWGDDDTEGHVKALPSGEKSRAVSSLCAWTGVPRACLSGRASPSAVSGVPTEGAPACGSGPAGSPGGHLPSLPAGLTRPGCG